MSCRFGVSPPWKPMYHTRHDMMVQIFILISDQPVEVGAEFQSHKQSDLIEVEGYLCQKSPFNIYAGTLYIYDRNFWHEWSPKLTFEVVFPKNHLVWQCFLQESLLNRKPTYCQELFDLVIYCTYTFHMFYTTMFFQNALGRSQVVRIGFLEVLVLVKNSAGKVPGPRFFRLHKIHWKCWRKA